MSCKNEWKFLSQEVKIKILIIDFLVNNGTEIAITLDPLTFILSPVVGGEDKGEGVV